MSVIRRTQIRAKEAKKGLECRRAGFMRRHSPFKSLLKAKVQDSMLAEAYEALRQAYESLDKSYKDYTVLSNKATIMAKNDCLEEFVKLYSEVQVTYSQVLGKREKAKVLINFEGPQRIFPQGPKNKYGTAA